MAPNLLSEHLFSWGTPFSGVFFYQPLHYTIRGFLCVTSLEHLHFFLCIYLYIYSHSTYMYFDT